MPELPEVETVRRGLAPLVTGKVIRSVRLNRAGLRFAFPPLFAARLKGRRITAVGRRAKYLLLSTEGEDRTALVLTVHLGMSGRFFVARADHQASLHDHVGIEFEDGSELVFNDARRFGSMDLVPASELEGHRALALLGPEPLGNEFSGPLLFAQTSKRRTTMKAALMDQHIVAGLGNIYVCEALFAAAIDPRRPANALTASEADRLAAAIRQVLEAALASGGSSLRDYVNASGEAGRFQHRFQVYDHEGEPCPRCAGNIIERIVQGGRSTWFCPACQH